MKPALLLVLLLLAPSAGATHPEPMPQPGTVWTVLTTVDALVRDNYATVKVVADIRNQGPDPEFPFVVRIPDDAFVTGLVIERDGTVYEAEVKDRDAARQEYEEWKHQAQTGALVEKARRTSVYSYLVNVAEFTNVRATLTYERYLAADRGVYNLSLEAPVSGFGRDLGAKFRVEVRDSDGVAALWGSPSGSMDGVVLAHEVGPRHGVESPTPFTAYYTLAPTADAGSLLTYVHDGKGYFAHRFRAVDDAPQLPMDLVLVLDVSGSMAGLKLRQMVDAAKQVVQALDEDDRLHLVAFSSDSRSAWAGLRAMTPEARRDAAREIDALFDGGGTNIEAGLRTGFGALALLDASASEGRFPALVLLTDGQPTAGTTSREGLRALARDANTLGAPVFGIAFGDDADWALVRHLSDDGEGAAIRVPLGQGAEVDLRRFMAALTTPVLRDVRIAYSEGVVAFRPGAPVLFAGSELLVVGTFDPALGISGAVTGRSPEGERRYAFAGGAPGALPFLPRLVAYHQVRDLQEDDAPDVATIKRLALEHSFVTDHTSLVLTVPAREWDGRLVAVDGDTRMREMASSCSGCAPPPKASCSNCAATDAVAGYSYAQPPSTGPQDPVDPAPGPSREVAPDAYRPAIETAAVPGAGAAFVVLAVAMLALLARRRL